MLAKILQFENLTKLDLSLSPLWSPGSIEKPNASLVRHHLCAFFLVFLFFFFSFAQPVRVGSIGRLTFPVWQTWLKITPSVTEVGTVIKDIARLFPSLCTLGLSVSFPHPHIPLHAPASAVCCKAESSRSTGGLPS
jgi:hypothetical protein